MARQGPESRSDCFDGQDHEGSDRRRHTDRDNQAGHARRHLAEQDKLLRDALGMQNPQWPNP